MDIARSSSDFQEQLKKLLDGPKTLADIWTRWRMRITLTLPRGTSGNVTKTTGSLSQMQACTCDWERRLLRCCEGSKRLASERRTTKQLSDFTKPSDSSTTISRKAMDMEFLVHTIFVFDRMGKGRKRCGLLKKWKMSIFPKKKKHRQQFRLQEMAIPLWTTEGVNSTPHRARVTHANIFSRVAQGPDKGVRSHCCSFLLSFLEQSSSRALVMSHTWLDRALFLLPHSTPSSPSLLDRPNRTKPCVPPQGPMLGRFAEQSPFTGYEPNVPSRLAVRTLRLCSYTR